eukprot:NODE_6610_length_1655_cov_18.001963.p1 GENE.NODE_6610_length_1655_cov_18.001963~~NODE_6610_length_1655_cov_18.001963.p1  ORF type:complete len:511 (-),score=161.27 NODE_6610_length_1655_cov_18.001963:122-1582(-)
MQAKDAYLAVGDELGAAKALYCLSLSRVLALLDDDCMSPAREAATIFEKYGLKSHQGMMHAQIASWHLHLKQYAEAIEPANEALQIFADYDGPDNGWLEAAVKSLFDAHMELDELEEAEELLTAWMKNFKARGQKEAMATMYECYVEYWSATESYREALDCGYRALACVRAVGNKRWEAKVLATVASLLLQMKDGNKAQRYVRQALQVFKQVDDEFGEMEVTALFADICASIGNHKQAISTANHVRAYYNRMQEPQREGDVVSTIARVHLWAGAKEAALDATAEAIDLYRSCEHYYNEVIALVDSHEIHLLTGDTASAIRVLEQAIALADLQGVELAGERARYVLEEVRAANRKPGDGAVTSSGATLTHSASAADGVITDVVSSVNPGLDESTVLEIVTYIAREVSSSEEEIEIDQPLMEAGMDSLSAVAFRNQLMHTFGGMSLPASLIFDAPSIRLVCQDIVERSKALPELPQIQMTATTQMNLT